MEFAAYLSSLVGEKLYRKTRSVAILKKYPDNCDKKNSCYLC